MGNPSYDEIQKKIPYLLLEGSAKEQSELMKKYVNNEPIKKDINYLN